MTSTVFVRYRHFLVVRKFSKGLLSRAVALLLISLCLTGAAYGQEASNRIEELVINATRLPRTINDIAGTVSVISAADIEQQLVNDLDDISRYQPGITMNTAARGGNQGFTIRGIGGNRVLTVIDGVRGNDIYSAGPSSYGKDSIETDDLKAVEIIRGPASVLYGADAMGGVVLLNSKEAKDYLGSDSGRYFDIRSSTASSNDQNKLGFTAAFQAKTFGLVAQYTHRNFQEQEVSGPGFLNPQNGDTDGFLLKAFWDLSDSQQLVFTLNRFVEDNNIKLNSDAGGRRSVTDSLGMDETERGHLGLTYRWSTASALFDSLEFTLHQQRTDALQHTEQERTSFSFLNPADPGSYGGSSAHRVTDFEFNQETFAAGINLRKTISGYGLNHAIAYGFNYDRTDTERPRNRCEEQLSTGTVTCNISASAPRKATASNEYTFAPTENFPNKTFPDSRTERNGFYIQDEIQPEGWNWTFIPGLRHDRYKMKPKVNSLLDSSGIIGSFGGFEVASVNEGATSLSLGAIYDLSSELSLFVQYAEGYRPPNFDESNQAFVNLAHGYATVPNPDLEAESSKGVELGIRANFENAFLSLAVYKNHYEDFINSQFVGIEDSIYLYQDRNIDEVEIRGAELSSVWYLSDQWQLRSSLAYSHGDNLQNDSPLDSVDPLTAVFGLRFAQADGRWGGELMLTAVDEKTRVSSDTVVKADSYNVVDLIANYRLSEGASLRAGIFNLFDETYARWTNIQGLNTKYSSTSKKIANAQHAGTNFRVGFNYQF